MKVISKDQEGFTVVEGLLMILIFVVICGVGYMVYRNHHKAQSNTTTTNSSQTADTKKVQNPTKQSYLDIKEWGVKLPLSSSISDAYYVISTNSETNGQPNTMWLGLRSLDKSGCSATQANSGGAYPIGAIIKAKPTDTDPVSGTPIKQLDPDGVTIDGYYYAYHSGTKGKTCAPQATLVKIDAAFKAAASKIIAEPTLGVSWAPSQQGYGTASPTELNNGGDPTGIVTDIKWQSWGGAQAMGSGTSDYVSGDSTVSSGAQEQVTVVAFKLGTCQGKPAYTAVEWFFPGHGQVFNPSNYRNTCTGSSVAG